MATAHDAPTPQESPAPAPVPAKVRLEGDSLGLFWGGAMLVLFAIWLSNSFPDLSGALLAVFWLLGIGSFAVGAWQWSVRRQAERTGDLTAFERHRGLVGVILIVAGFVLAGLTAYLVFTLRLQGFSESVGLGLFALIPLIAGLVHVRPTASSANFVGKVLKSYTMLQNALLVLGVAGVLVFLWLSFFRKIGLDWFPELAALLFESLLCLTCAFWLISSQPSERTEFSLRCLLLVLGAGSGLILTLFAAVLTYIWRQDALLGGLVVWQSEANGWKFWLCAYLGLVGLVLMFASVMLGRSEVRSHPVLRQTLFGYNALVTGFLLLAFLGVFNVVSYAMFPMTFEWASTRGGLSGLAPASKSLLASLKEPTTVYVLLSQSDQVFTDIQALMGNCLVYTDKMRVRYISPDTDYKAFDELAQRFPEILPSARALRSEEATGGRGLLIVYGSEEGDKKTPHTFIPSAKLSKVEREGEMPHGGGKGTLVFKGEIELMNELSFLTAGKEERKVYFLQGNGELDINDKGTPRHSDFRDTMAKFGAFNLVDRLKKDNYRVSGLSFGRKKDKVDNVVFLGEDADSGKTPKIPEDAFVVVIAGASEELPPTALQTLEDYIGKGGKVFVSFDVVFDSKAKVMVKTGLEGLLKKHGVLVDDSFVMRAGPDDPRLFLAVVPAASDSELAKQFKRSVFRIDSARVVKPDPGAKSKAEVLLETGLEERFGAVWIETNPRAMQMPGQFFKELASSTRELRQKLTPKLAPEPVPVAVTVTTESGKPSMIVFGDTDLLANESINESESGQNSYSFFVSALEWMAERKGFQGPRPKTAQIFSLNLGVDRSRMVFLPVWFMFLGTVGLGAGIWLVRRR